MISPDHLIQVCTPDLITCEWFPASELSSFPVLSVEDAMLLSSAVTGLFALVWVFRKLQAAF